MTTTVVDHRMVEHTRTQVRAVLARLAREARSTADRGAFERSLLDGIVEVTAAAEASIWEAGDSGWQFRSGRPTNDEAIGPSAAALDAMTASTAGRAFSADLNADKHLLTDTDGPGDWLLAPVRAGNSANVVILALRTRQGLSPAARDGQLRLLEQAAEIAAEFHDREAARSADEQRRWLLQVEQFCREIYASLDETRTALAIVNAGLAPSGADRMMLAWGRGSAVRLLAISGQDRFDRRAPVLRQLRQFLARMRRVSKPVLADEERAEWPAGCEQAGERYRLESGGSAMVFLPLRPGGPQSKPGLADGWLVLEWFDRTHLPSDWLPRWQTLADHAAAAQSHAADHERGLLSALLEWGSASRLGRLARWAVLASLVGMGAWWLAVTPGEFVVHAPGVLQPARQRDVFAPRDGEVARVAVGHGQRVAVGEVLVELRDEELEVRLQRILAEQQEVETAIESLRRQRLAQQRLSDEGELAGQLRAYEERLIGLQDQAILLQSEVQHLQAASPIAGEVLTWDTERRLLTRPVQRGQILLTVADPEGPWILEVPLPEERLGDLPRHADRGPATEVEFVLATQPEKVFRGQLESVAQRAELDPKQRNIIKLRVAIDRGDIPAELLRPGVTVQVQIHCGQRPLAACLFHDVVRWIRREVVFRLL